MADLCNKKNEKDKTDLMSWLDFNKILKILIEEENKSTFIEDATSKVRIFL